MTVATWLLHVVNSGRLFICRCCRKCILNSRKQRKLSSQEGAAVVLMLLGLFQERSGGQKSQE